jgi:hypothetical protein
MEDFYFYTCVVALIILLLMLTMVGITISYGNKIKIFPPTQSSCPDYWAAGKEDDISGNMIKTGTTAENYCKVPKSIETNSGNSEFLTNNVPTDWDAIKTGIGGNTASTSNGYFYIQLNNSDASWNAVYPGMTVRCAKRKWALDNGITWDGVSNYNGCT